MILPKALLILPDYPFPINNGYQIKASNFINSLTSKYNLTVITVTYKKCDKLQMEKYLKDITFSFQYYKIGIFEATVNLLRSFLYLKPIQQYLFSSKNFKRHLEENQHFDIVFFSTVRTCLYINSLPNSKIVIDFIDSIGLNYFSAIKNSRSYIKNLFYWYEAKKLYNFEIESSKKANFSLFVNHLEAENFKKYSSNIYYIPNGVKPELLDYMNFDPKFSNSITFLGTMNYQPNIDAMYWFINNVFNLLDNPIKLYIIGSNPPNFLKIKALKFKNIFFTNFIDDPYLIINSSFCFVAPMQNGAGIQNKVIESMALGKVVILTKKAASPFAFCKHNVHFIICDEPKKFAYYINDIFLNPEKYRYIQTNAKNIILNYYNWEAYSTKLYHILQLHKCIA